MASKEIHFIVSKEYMNMLRERIGACCNEEVLRRAFRLINWAVDESIAGRAILSSEKDGSEIERLNMPELERLRLMALG